MIFFQNIIEFLTKVFKKIAKKSIKNHFQMKSQKEKSIYNPKVMILIIHLLELQIST
jgi:hypothetical protein